MSLSNPNSSSRDASSRRDGIAVLHASVLQAAVRREKIVAAQMDVFHQGDRPKFAHVLLDGLACRYRAMPDGRRQITAVLIPGDICDLEATLKGLASYSVSALTTCRLGEIAVNDLSRIDELDPELRQILWWQVLRDEAISREWMLSLGRRTALGRLAHLFCELWTRLRAVGLANADGCELRFTQSELGDILGLSSVHVNRTLQDLRATGLIQYQSGILRIFDHPGLAKVACFDPGYLDHAHP